MNTRLKALLAILLIVGLLLIPLPYPQTVEAQGWLDGWGKRVEFTIDHNDIDVNVTWFPVLLHLSTESGTGIVEEQTAEDRGIRLYSGATIRIGQKLTISDRVVTKLSFLIWRGGFPIGNVTFTIRQLDDTILASEVWGDSNTLTISPTWHTVTFDTPVLVNETVRLSCEYSGGDSSDYVMVQLEGSDVKASEEFTYYVSSWTDYTPWDCAYKYTYTSDVSCIFDEVGANSTKIAITKADGTTELYGEVDNWDATNETADIHTSRDGWVISNTTNTTGYLYYDNTHANNTAYIGLTNSTPAENVWDNNFVGVWHMADGASNATIYDSTSNDNDGTKKGANEPNEVAGLIGYAQEFNGTDNDINVGQDGSLDIDAMTLSVLVYPTAVGSYRTFIGSYTDAENWFQFRINDDGVITCYGRDSNVLFRAYTDDDITADTWYRIVTTATSGEVIPKIYINGDDKAISEANDVAGNVTHRILHGNLSIGEGYNNDRFYEGKKCDVRISNIVRPDEWNKAEYQSDIDHLVTWGSEETAPVEEMTYGYIIG